MKGKTITIDFTVPSTQRESVLWHLNSHGKLSSWEAIKEYGITRLASIIHSLRNEGYNIISEPVNKRNRFGNTVVIANYLYVKPKPKAGVQLDLLTQIEEHGK